MLKEGSINSVSVPTALEGVLIPLLPIDAIAGFGSGNWSIHEHDIQEKYLVPDFNGIDFMIRIKGSSMYPKYNSGDVVACRKINHKSYIQWNKPHVISTKEQGIIVKRINKAQEKQFFTLVSDNQAYPPFDIPQEEITGIALIIGVIRLE
ncbi:MAG: S24 family peptidase [Vicingaceae bacterium]|nr:S24 family peptidase [Vicingaceae bacterium]